MPTDPVELLISLMTIGWGVWVINPYWNTFANPAYASMQQLANFVLQGSIGHEILWGSVFCFVGVMQFLSLLADNRQYRTIAIILSGWLWTFVTLTFVTSNIAVTAVPSYAIIALATLWTHIRLWTQTRSQMLLEQH